MSPTCHSNRILPWSHTAQLVAQHLPAYICTKLCSQHQGPFKGPSAHADTRCQPLQHHRPHSHPCSNIEAYSKVATPPGCRNHIITHTFRRVAQPPQDRPCSAGLAAAPCLSSCGATVPMLLAAAAVDGLRCNSRRGARRMAEVSYDCSCVASQPLC